MNPFIYVFSSLHENCNYIIENLSWISMLYYVASADHDHSSTACHKQEHKTIYENFFPMSIDENSLLFCIDAATVDNVPFCWLGFSIIYTYRILQSFMRLLATS